MRLGKLMNRFGRIHSLLLALLMALPAPVVAEEWIYTVRPGDNLWNLTERHLNSMDYVPQLQQLNKVQNPYVIPPGTQLRIPVVWSKVQNTSARVISVYGAAALLRKDQERMPVEQGMQLLIDDEIHSGNDAFVTVEFADNSHLRVQENTRLRFDNMRIFGDYGLTDTLIDLQQGRTENTVPEKSGKATRFRIKTPSAISSVRGTDFRVGIPETQAGTSSEVLSGHVEVAGEKRNVKVAAGFGTMTAQGMPPVSPVKLLPPPDLSGTAHYYQSLPLVIKFSPLKGAHAYRAQIAADRDFKNLRSEFTTASLPFRDGEIPDGDYWLRVRGIDRLSIEGKDAVIPFSLNAYPEAPFILAPLPGGMAEPEKQQFKWAAQADVSHYAIMISKDADFSTALYFNPEVKENSVTLSESLTPGHYFWRIFSVSAHEGAGPFSDTMAFRVPYPAPAVGEAQLDDGKMTFAWRAAEEGQSFQFQFARDREFANIIHEESTAASQLTIAKPDSGTYYLRIKTIESDGFQGPWGKPQAVDVPFGISYWFMLLMLLPLLVLI
ncbi:MAG: FecR domain-containing protein [Gammaproteobacteria bacterium]|nr:MAG: FecR domain-containing protein [Gammaproteobacteria bacterium]